MLLRADLEMDAVASRLLAVQAERLSAAVVVVRAPVPRCVGDERTGVSPFGGAGDGELDGIPAS